MADITNLSELIEFVRRLADSSAEMTLEDSGQDDADDFDPEDYTDEFLCGIRSEYEGVIEQARAIIAKLDAKEG